MPSSESLSLNEIRELIIEFYSINDPAKLRGGLDVHGMAVWTKSKGIEALNEVLWLQFQRKIDLKTDIGTGKDQVSRLSNLLGGEARGSVVFEKEEEQRQDLLKKLEAFYAKHDTEQMTNRDLDKLVSFAMFHGVDTLDEKLRGKYGEGIIEVKEPEFIETEQIDDEKLYAQLKVFFGLHDPAWLDNLNNVVDQAHNLGIKGLNKKLHELYGQSLNDVPQIASQSRVETVQLASNPLADFATSKKVVKVHKGSAPPQLIKSLSNKLSQKYAGDALHQQNTVAPPENENARGYANYDESFSKRSPIPLLPVGKQPKVEELKRQSTDVITVDDDLPPPPYPSSLLMNENEKKSLEKRLNPQPVPVKQEETSPKKRFKVNISELTQQLTRYYEKHDFEELENVDDVVDLAEEIGEDALNIKLEQFYGETLRAFLEREARKPKAPPKTPRITKPEKPQAEESVQTYEMAEDEEFDEEKVLEEIKVFYAKNDPNRLETLDSILRLAQQIGYTALNSYLKDFYGEDLQDVMQQKAEIEAKEAEARERALQKKKTELQAAQTASRETSKKERNLREDLTAYYQKHDAQKLEAIDTIVELGNKIGRDNLNTKLAQIYGESLDDVTLSAQDSLPETTLQDPVKVEAPKSVATSENKREENKPAETKDAQVTDKPRTRKKKKRPPPGSVRRKEGARKGSRKGSRAGGNRPARNGERKRRPRPKGQQKKPINRNPESARLKLLSFKGEVKPIVPVQMLTVGRGKSVRDVLGDSPVESGACNNYRLDMTGASFGVCKCGFPRADHNKKTKKPAWAVNV